MSCDPTDQAPRLHQTSHPNLDKLIMTSMTRDMLRVEMMRDDGDDRPSNHLGCSKWGKWPVTGAGNQMKSV